jgi:hypothetical protein
MNDDLYGYFFQNGLPHLIDHTKSIRESRSPGKY